MPAVRAAAAAAAAAPEQHAEPINTDDFYLQMEQVPPAALTSPAPIGNGSEWTPAERIDRPVIRPQMLNIIIISRQRIVKHLR